jgi:hypothetical protein
MRVTATVRTWFANWRRRADDKHRSGWDNPTTGADLLAAMVDRERAKKRKLP